ncbi:MAG TPA: DUF3450 domain-containing protein [Crenotrichaceae bacterium]|nr:DUF3450 domain-containing protein [Crenotrichaceae bacterium]
MNYFTFKGRKYCRYSCLFFTMITFFNSAYCNSADISQAIQLDAKRTRLAKHSQSQIDKMDDQQHRLAQQYRQMLKEIDNLGKYNDYLQNVVDSQQQETISLHQQIQDLEETQHEIVPLMLSMMYMLKQFVAADIPFLADERDARLKKLDSTMARADVAVSEKFRRILEAYQIENDYGYTIEAYRGVLEINGQTNPVDFFRLGRVAMFYQTLDGKKTGVWNQGATQWESLSDSYQRSIRQGLRMARKETAPDMLVLPIPTAESVQ